MKRRAENSVQKQLQVGARTIPYTLTLANRKSVGITIRPDLRVEVRARRGSSEATIEEILHQRAHWIVHHLERFAARPATLTLARTPHADSYLHLGQRLPLTIHTGQRQAAVTLAAGQLHVWAKDEARVERLLGAWSRQQAEIVFAQRMVALLCSFGELKPPALKIRRMRARWGSCSTSGTITLNLKLIHLDVALIDYVIMHELCHLIEHNHSKHYYTLLTRKMPDWQPRRDRLNALGMPE